MSAVWETSVGISSITGALVTSLITGLFISLTIVPTSKAEAQLTGGTNNSNTTNLPVTEAERQRYLNHLQSETTSTMIPALVFLAILVVAGAVGNSLVIFVYSRKLQWSATRILIISLAMVDLVANIIAIPGEMYDMFHIWDFDNPALCRARLYCSTFSTLSSAMILLAVAVTRYRKVCHPHHWQISTSNAKVISIVLASIGALVSIPYAILNGRQTKKTPRSDILAYECTTDDEYRNTIFPLANYAFFLVMYISCSVSLTVLYILIGAKAWKHSKLHGGSPGIPTPASENATSSKYTSNVVEQSNNDNEYNKCGSPYNKKVDKSIKDKAAIQGTRQGEDIKMKQFPVGNEINGVPFRYNIRVFADRIEVWTPMVGEFFVKVEKAQPDEINLPSHGDREHNNTDNEKKTHQSDGSEEDTHFGNLIENNMCGGENRVVNSNFRDDNSNGKYNAICADGFFNRENKTELSRTADDTNETVNTLHSYEHCEDTGPVHKNNLVNLCTGANNDPYHPQSMQAAVSEAHNQSDPWPLFKWLDVIYCSDDEYTTFDSNCVQRDTSLSFRLALNNDLLQRAEWLRTSVIEAMKRQEQTTEAKSGNNFLEQTPSVNNTHASSNSSGADRDKGTTETVHPQHNTNISRTTETVHPQHNTNISRLREIMAKRLSSLKTGSQRQKIRRRPIGRITIMLIIISAIYILGYLPHLALMFLKFLSPDIIVSMSMVDLTFYNLFLRTYFLNCAANPIVYSLCDSNFRLACLKVIKCS